MESGVDRVDRRVKEDGGAWEAALRKEDGGRGEGMLDDHAELLGLFTVSYG